MVRLLILLIKAILQYNFIADKLIIGHILLLLGKNQNLLYAIVDSYFDYQSDHLLKLLMVVHDPHHKVKYIIF